jgi:hypothetical protein
MSNPNERQTFGREESHKFYTGTNGNTHTQVTKTTETVNNTGSFRDGYLHGQVAERGYQEETLTERDNNNAARGLLLGIILTSLAALTVGVVWFLNQSNEAPTQVLPPVIVPNSQPNDSPSPEANQPPAKETIIERTRDVLVPVPQQSAPQAPSPAPQPDINITVPNSAPQQPTAKQAPATETVPPASQSQSDSTEVPDTQTDSSDTVAPDRDASNQIDTTSDSTSAQ